MMNKLAKWRNVLTGWQLGTRKKGDPEGDAVRDHREVTIIMRAELNALVGLLIKKKVFTLEEWDNTMYFEAQALDKDYERRFPGITTDHESVHYKLPEAAETMKGWRP